MGYQASSSAQFDDEIPMLGIRMDHFQVSQSFFYKVSVSMKYFCFGNWFYF